MAYEIELIEDGDGVAVIGPSAAVEQFLALQELPSQELDLTRIGATFGSAAGLAHAGSAISAESGRWVKLTRESAAAFKTSNKMKGSSDRVSRATLTEKNGRIKGIPEIVDGPGQMLSNPAILAGAAGVMAQIAMQQTMDEITDYLAVIDAKVDDVLRAQKDSVIADMIGVDVVLDEALAIRGEVGRVSDITWSKVQSTVLTIGRTQAYALKQLAGIAEKLGQHQKVNDLADASGKAERTVQEWLAVIAHCFRLQDAIAVLELDRVRDSSPEELDDHRRALRLARDRRLGQLTSDTALLLERMDSAAGAADAKLLLNPKAAPKVLLARNRVHGDVIGFQQALGIAGDRSELESRRWWDAAVEARDRVVATAVDGVGSALQSGTTTIESARTATGRAAEGLSRRLQRSRTDDRAGGGSADATDTGEAAKWPAGSDEETTPAEAPTGTRRNRHRRRKGRAAPPGETGAHATTMRCAR